MHIGPPSFDEHISWGVSCFDIVENNTWSDGICLGFDLDEYVEKFTEGVDRIAEVGGLHELPIIKPVPSGVGLAIVVAKLWASNSVDAVLWAVSEADRLGFRVVVLVAFDWRDWGVVEASWEDLDSRLGASIERHVFRSKPDHPGDKDNYVFYAAWEANQLLGKLIGEQLPLSGD